MVNLESFTNEIAVLKTKVKELEEELECKDIKHLHELRLMRNHLENVMNKYCLN